MLIRRQAILVSHRNKHNAHSPQAAGCHLNALGPSRFDHGNRGNMQAHCLDFSLSNTFNVYEPNEASCLWRTPTLRKQYAHEGRIPLSVRMMVVPLPSNIMLHHAKIAFAYARSWWRRDNFSKPPGLLGSS